MCSANRRNRDDPQPGEASAVRNALIEGRRPDPAPPIQMRLRDYLRLRPYGDQLLTPAAIAWLGSAWVVILLMASIEGFVWGAVGLSLVPKATPWLAPPVALFMFALMFSVIWIVDASLIMSERPRLRRAPGDTSGGLGSVLRWGLGIAARLAIVGISLYVTAPFVEKLIRADDIAGWHQAQVEHYFAERNAALREQAQARAEQLGTGYGARIESLEQQIERLDKALATERERRERIETEYRPEIAVLANDLAEARRRVGDELLGREGRPEGYGPEARKWDARAERLAQTLADKQAELDARLSPVEKAIAEQREQLDTLNQALVAVRAEEQALLERISAEVEAQQPPPQPPKLTFAARSKALNALRQSTAERGVPHFETVAGFAQAALGILFFALIALKLFEPDSVHAYFSEAVQHQYQLYLNGGLAHIPGFQYHDDPTRRLSPVEFARRWQRWERDPEAFVAERRSRVDAESRLARLNEDLAHERELLGRRRERIDHQLALEHRQREAELRGHEQEVSLRLEALGRRLADETETTRRQGALQLERAQHAESDARLAAERARRDAHIEERRQGLDEARAELSQHRDHLAELEARRRSHAEALSETQAQIDAAQARIPAQQAQLEALRRALVETDDPAATGNRAWIGEGPAERRRLRRAIRRAEKALAPQRKALDDLRGRLAVLLLEEEQLDRAVSDARIESEKARQRRDGYRAGIDALLLAPPRPESFDDASSAAFAQVPEDSPAVEVAKQGTPKRQ